MMARAAYKGLLCLALAASLQADTVVLGNPPMVGTGNCDPFGCPNFLGLDTYQQVYLSAAFPGSIAISGLTFYEGQVVDAPLPAGGTYTLSFSYTSFNPGDLNLVNPGNNIGPGSQTFFAGALPPITPVGPGGAYLVIDGTPFVYNPADGNLLLTVTVTGGTDAVPTLFLNEAACGPKTACPPGSTVVSSNAYFAEVNSAPVSGGNDVGGLVTGFTYTPLTVPEPASLLLVLAGIGLCAAGRARRRLPHA